MLRNFQNILNKNSLERFIARKLNSEKKTYERIVKKTSLVLVEAPNVSRILEKILKAALCKMCLVEML